MNKKIIGVVVVLLVVAGFGTWFFMSGDKDVMKEGEMSKDADMMSEPTPDASMGMEVSPEASPAVSGEPAMMGEVKEFTVTGSNFSFDPSEIKVKKGDTVKITFKNSGGMHDWVLEEFNVRTKRIQGGEQEVVEFVADKTGTFEYYCSVGSHRAMGMKGNLIVE